MASSSSGGESNDGNHNLDWSATSLSSSNFSIGGGRPDGSFNFFQGLHQPPASYEDFTWPSPFNLQDAPSHSYQSPPSSHEAPPVPSSSWFPSLFPSTTSTSSLPPPPSLPPSAPTPLLDSTEQSLFSTFLTTLDIDPKFLFNPVLPPGMPSPPNLGMVPGNEDNWREEGREREDLGKSVGGMGLSEERDYDEGEGIANETTTMKRQGRGRDGEVLEERYREDEEEEIETPQGGDQDDSDFDPTREEGDYTETRRPRGGGGESRPLGTTRRKSRSGGVSGSATNLDRERGGKKLRISPQPTTTTTLDDGGHVPIVQEDDEDAIMEESEELEREEDDPDYSERVPPPPPLHPHALSSSSTTRSKRARPPSTAASSRRNSASSSSATTSTTTASTTPNPRRPSLSKPLAPPPPPPPSTKVLPRQALLDNPPQHLSHSQKRQNHIESEQRRRNAIKLNFKDLVELVIRGQSLSRVILGADLPEEEDAEGSEEEEGGGGRIGRGGKKRAVVKKGKRASATTTGGGPGRGRGRKGDTGANASKSVVLERAKDYICWLEKGNRALEREVQRVKALLAGDQ